MASREGRLPGLKALRGPGLGNQDSSSPRPVCRAQGWACQGAGCNLTPPGFLMSDCGHCGSCWKITDSQLVSNLLHEGPPDGTTSPVQGSCVASSPQNQWWEVGKPPPSGGPRVPAARRSAGSTRGSPQEGCSSTFSRPGATGACGSVTSPPGHPILRDATCFSRSHLWLWKWKWSRVRLFTTPWTVAHQAPLSMGFSRQEHWRGLPFPLALGAFNCRKCKLRRERQASPVWATGPSSLRLLRRWQITNTRRFVSKIAEIIETEFGIRALQAALVERRNKDRVGHVFCNLRLIIVPEGAARGEAAREPAPSSPSRPPSNPGAGRRGERALEGSTQVRESFLHGAVAAERARLGAGLRLRGMPCQRAGCPPFPPFCTLRWPPPPASFEGRARWAERRGVRE